MAVCLRYPAIPFLRPFAHRIAVTRIVRRGAVSSTQADSDPTTKGRNPRDVSDISSEKSPAALRLNAAQIQMIPESQRTVLFNTPLRELDPAGVQGMVEHLRSKGLWGFEPQILPAPTVQLPEMLGGSVEEHFRRIAEEQTRPYVSALDGLLRGQVPSMPAKWEYKAGWTKYEKDGTPYPIAYPDADALVFDVETCLSAGKYATLAAAVSADHWYTWCSSRLVNETPELLAPGERLDLRYLIPLETDSSADSISSNGSWRKERIVVGHNVAFDRSYIREQYLMEGSRMRFLDTMSLHIALAGFTTAQRAVHMKMTASRKKTEPPTEAEKKKEAAKLAKKKGAPENVNSRRWMEVGSMNNLEAVYQLHCDAILPYDKALSRIFVDGNLNDVRDNFDALMSYCANDVRATHQLAQALVPKFREAAPHPVTFGGLLEMSSVYLPVNKNWEIYISKSNEACTQIEDDLRRSLVKLAVDAVGMREGEAYKDDLWLWDLDWSSQKVTSRTKNLDLAALPNWYRELSKKSETVDAKGIPTPEDVSLRMRLTPKLMRLTWNGWPLHHTPEHGWGWLEPAPPDLEIVPRVELFEVKPPTKGKVKPPAEAAPFPLHKLHELAVKLGRPIGIAKSVPLPQPVATTGKKKNAVNTAVVNTVVSEEDWEKLGDMSPEEQRAFFAQNSSVSSFAGLAEGKNRVVRVLPPVTEVDQELSSYLSEDIEMREFQAKQQKRPPKVVLKKIVSPLERNEFYDVIPGCVFRRLTHANGLEHNVGSPLSKDFLQHFESGMLKASFGSASDAIRLSKMVSYWHNNKDRIESQLIGDLKVEDMPVTGNRTPPSYTADDRYGALLPRLAYMGTVTRRAVESTWMTASNVRSDRIGSELKAMIQSPPGYSIVGADVDSQELWIAAILGDSNWLKEHGCTAFGWMTLQGNKADGTDLHSKTAAQAGVERDQAKILNYGRIYGAGRDYAAVLLRNFNHELSEAQATGKAQKIYSFSKGYRQYRLNTMGKFLALKCGLNETDVEAPFKFSSLKEIYEMTSGKKVDVTDRRELSKVLSQLTESSFWNNGSESYMFNKLEAIATSAEPRTPVLDVRISRALMKENVEDDFLTSRVNWVVQSSAVDYLHLMLVCMKWLMTKYDIRGRFCLSIHDEVRYLVEDDDRDRAVLALHLTNLLTRAMFAHRLGMYDLPLSIAYFSAVDVDRVLRKDASVDCLTPSNPQGLERTYGVPKGEALSVFDAVARTGGRLDKQ
ncbi:DNA polymerase subunit gamma-1 [Hypsibius exemplaris]|uniref:DNA polymerase subunit gamma-1 n=1 Tax=Hypsibius exemplaris TaxID=2072580 RepID=A0A1W0X3H3_HYPEX|nr:DNA polymerase subunit gamma-1 [Hypsibius exemplaris]